MVRMGSPAQGPPHVREMMMKKLILALCFVLIAPQATWAITANEARAEAEAWIIARKDVILDRVTTCIQESTANPKGSECHTAWAASVTPNTASIDSALATVTLDDPGRITVDACANECATGIGTFAGAGIAIPATAPVNAKINVAKGPGGWGAQVVIRVRYDTVLYERAYGVGIFDGFDWREVEEIP
jgi:hypothetical protein